MKPSAEAVSLPVESFNRLIPPPGLDKGAVPLWRDTQKRLSRDFWAGKVDCDTVVFDKSANASGATFYMKNGDVVGSQNWGDGW